MDTLKTYLQEYRAALDVEIPPADLWQHIQAGTAAQAAKAMLIKYIVGIGIVAMAGAGVWMMSRQQQTTPAPVPLIPPSEVIIKDTVPGTPSQQPAPAVQPKKKKIQQRPPAPPAVRKHKKAPAPAAKPVPPRKKKKAVRPLAGSVNIFPAPASVVPVEWVC